MKAANFVLWGFGADSGVFNASQYAFFGRDIAEEIELGGLEDEEVREDASSSGVPVAGGFGGGDDEIHEYHLFEKDEVCFLCYVLDYYPVSGSV